MEIKEINVSLIAKSQLKMKKLNLDSDDVYDLGLTEVSWMTRIRRKHFLHDSHDGWCAIICPKTKHMYLHIINCPNKFALVCRGCGAEI